MGQRSIVKANGSYQFSDEHRANIGASGRGRVPWNKGIRQSIET